MRALAARHLGRASRLLVAALTLLGFAARVWHLGAKGLWFDEALSVSTASLQFGSMLGTLVAEDIHPPLSYAILHFWMPLAGRSEFAIRFPALLTGTALIPATYVLALALLRANGHSPPPAAEVARRGLVTRATATLAAGLVAASPFLIYYSQEARMYGDLAFWSLLSSLALWKWLEREEPARWLLAYVAATVAALYTHYFFGLALAFQGAYLALAAARRPRLLLRFLPAGAAVALLYAPWLHSAYSQLSRMLDTPDYWQGELSLAFIAERVFAALAVGKSGAALQSLPVLAAAVALFGLGLLAAARRGLAGRQADLYSLLYLLVPLLALYAITARNPKFTERYLIVVAPIFYVIIARALVALAEAGRLVTRRWPLAPWATRTLAVAAVAVALRASLGELQLLYFGGGYDKDDNRGAIAYIAAHEQPGDVIVSMMDIEPVLEYYYHGQLPRYGLHPGPDTARAAALLNRYLAGKQRLWLLLWQESWADPSGFTRDSLDSTLTRLPGPGEYYGVKLLLYRIDQPVAFSGAPVPSRPLGVDFDNKLTLLGYDPPPRPVPAGGSADVVLYWAARQPLTRDYIVSLRLVADDYRWASRDQRPAAYTYPTTSWPVGPTVRGKVALPVPLGAPPGSYDLELVVYPQETHQDLPVLDSTGRPVAPRAIVGTVTVARPAAPGDPADLRIQQALERQFGQDLRLLGLQLDARSARPGAPLDLALYWQAIGQERGDDAVELTLLDSAGQTHSLASSRPAGGRYSTAEWQEGELVADRRRLLVPATAAPGEATLLVGLRRLPDGRPVATPEGEQVALAKLAVGERPRFDQSPGDVQHPLDLQVGDFARLVGYSLEPERGRPGGELRLALYWQARGASPAPYAVFTHLLDAESRIWAQQDGEPGGGALPTTGWLAGEYVRDEYRLTIKRDAPPGEYELEVGMYDPKTLTRLRVTGPDGVDGGDRVVLRGVEVR